MKYISQDLRKNGHVLRSIVEKAAPFWTFYINFYCHLGHEPRISNAPVFGSLKLHPSIFERAC